MKNKKRKNILAIGLLSGILLIFLIRPVSAATGISTCQQLQDMRNNLAEDYFLVNDIDCSATLGWNGGQGFEPVGSGPLNPFTGNFDGRGHKITGLFIYRDADYIGLFGYVGGVSEIKDISLINIDITGAQFIGSLVGSNDGTIINSSATGAVGGNYYIGGLAGINYGDITNSNAAVTVNIHDFPGSIIGNAYTGGLVSWNKGDIINCYATGNVNNSSSAGGLASGNWGNIINSYATGNVNGGTGSAGGLVDSNLGGCIVCSYATGSVTALSFVGGLASGNWGDITMSYATGNVSGSGYIGGFIGINTLSGSIIDSYATGSATGSHHIGGFTGDNSGGINNSYSMGEVTGTGSPGGFAGGFDDTWGGYCNSCFWDTQTSGQGSSACGDGRTTALMKTESTFTGAGWDFTTIWDIQESVTYPYLLWGGVCDGVCGTPDLIISANSYSPISPIAGNSMTFTGVVKNQGSSQAAASQTRLRIDIDNDGSYDITPANQSTAVLNAGATETETWSSVWTATAGTHKYEICADITDAVTESDGTNNCITRIFTVNPLANQCPQAAISCSPSFCSVYYKDTLILNNDSTDPDGQDDITKSKWYVKKEGDPTYQFKLECTTNPICNYTPQIEITPGFYTAKLYVEDASGDSSEDTKNFTIKPVITAGFMCSTDNINWQVCEGLASVVGDPVYFKDVFSLSEHSDPSGGATINSRVWKKEETIFDSDNNTNPSVIATSPSMTIELVITDTVPKSDSKTHEITVGAVVPTLPLPHWKEIAPF